MDDNKVAVVTGASSGIGAASARSLARDGWTVIAAARRRDRLEALAEQEPNITPWELDVTSDTSVAKLADSLKRVDLLVNNAGGAKGLEPLAETKLEDWQWMFDTNVMGTVRVTQALLPALEAAPENSGLIINMGSVAGWNVYEGGSAYNTAKHGVRVISRALRIENHNVRCTEIDPGRVATEEFSLNRFGGDADRAAAVYADELNLSAEDIAEAVRWVASLPAHVNVDVMTVKPRTQG